MNSTELDPSIQSAITIYHHVFVISGSLFLLVSGLVALLIFFDRDTRGREYRKHLLALQGLSMAFDLWFGIYNPIVQINVYIIFSDSIIAENISVV
ncbi:hypothetical protein PFISCL1PPCAC_16934, partial [Pristionchus fissidentatus]